MTRLYRWMLPLLGLWLLGWIVLSWAAVQDDAMIHLRYADNLYLHHFITYDGEHANYGASSLLYVSLLAVLRAFTHSSDLPRAVSSAVHGALFLGLAFLFLKRVPRSAKLPRSAGLLLLILVVTPSAVRWLDDGMETGLVLATVSLMAWMVQDACRRAKPSWRRDAILIALSFLAVLLRTELVLVCGVCFCLRMLYEDGHPRRAARISLRKFLSRAAGRAHTLVGAALALGVIVSTMHVLLPDTAVAKSLGIHAWRGTLMATGVTLSGALSFGIGLLLFWLLTIALVVLQLGRIEPATLVANSLAPIILLLSVLRGQQIQGVRYFGWAFFFSIVWNILDLAADRRQFSVARNRQAMGLLGAFAVLLFAELPYEAVTMHRVLTRRAATMQLLESQHLEVLKSTRGVASDIGYIGYFSQADICDLAGLVNGRVAARMNSAERAAACVRTMPEFFFGNATQIASMHNLLPMDGWRICGRYDFTNLSRPDTHYLVVAPALVERACRATASAPATIGSLSIP